MNLDKNFEMSLKSVNLSMLTGLWYSLFLHTFVYMYMYTTTTTTPTCTHQVRLWQLHLSSKVYCKSCLWHLAEIFHPLEVSLVCSYIGALSLQQLTLEIYSVAISSSPFYQNPSLDFGRLQFLHLHVQCLVDGKSPGLTEAFPTHLALEGFFFRMNVPTEET